MRRINAASNVARKPFSLRFLIVHIVFLLILTFLWSQRYVISPLFMYTYAVLIGIYASRGNYTLERLFSIYVAIAWVYYCYTYVFKIGGPNTPYNNPAPLWLLLVKDALFAVFMGFMLIFYKPKKRLIVPYILLLVPLLPHFLIKDWFYVLKQEYLDTFQFIGFLFLAKDRNIKDNFFDIALLMGFMAGVGAICQMVFGGVGPADLQLTRRASSTLGTSLTLGPALGLTFWISMFRLRSSTTKAFHSLTAIIAAIGIILSVSITSIVAFLCSFVVFILWQVLVRKKILKWLPFVTSLMIVAVAVFVILGKSFRWRAIDRIIKYMNVPMLLSTKHFQDIVAPFSIEKQNIATIVGLGPERPLESGYAQIYFDFGLIGLFAFLVVIGHILTVACKHIHKEEGFVAFFYLLMIIIGLINLKYLSMFPINAFTFTIIGILYTRVRWHFKVAK